MATDNPAYQDWQLRMAEIANQLPVVEPEGRIELWLMQVVVLLGEIRRLLESRER